MRIGIIGLQHESNTFVPTLTTMENFQREVVATGQGVRDFYGSLPHEIGGFFAAVEAAGDEAVPIFAASALPSGLIEAQTADNLVSMLLAALHETQHIDGLLVAPHGAAVSESHRDMDGYWLSRVRDVIGAKLPMVCTLDLHANLTQCMIDACDATVIYRTNPHLDQRARGEEAARLLLRTLRGETKPTQALALPPVCINIEKQLTDQAPCTHMYSRAAQLRSHDKVLSQSIALGFPYADVAEMGAGFVCVTDDDPALAQTLAEQMAQWLVGHRDTFVAELISVQDAIEQASACDGPVCLLDMGDNVGGGSAGDGTYIAQAVLDRGGPKTFVSIFDPQTVRQALDAGVGATLELSVGGKIDKMHGPPLESTFTVSKIHHGTFEERQIRHGGKTFYDMGPTVVLEAPCALTVQVTTHRTTPFSLGQVSCCVDPAQFQILIAKGVNAPVAAYVQVCDAFIRVNTAGSTSADMTSLTYRHRRRPLFPFEEIE